MIPLPIVLTSGDRDPSALVACIERQFGVCLVHRDRDGRGAAASTRDAIAKATAHASNTRGEPGDILFFEDDVELSTCCARLVAGLTWPEDVGVISLCDMRELPQGTTPGLYVRDPMGCDARGWWGNQAMLLRADVAYSLSNAAWRAETNNLPGVRAHVANWDDGGRNCSDIRMAHLVKRLGLQYAVLSPSIVRHVGMTSNCFPGRAFGLGERETRNWIGDLDYRWPTDEFVFTQTCQRPPSAIVGEFTTANVIRCLDVYR